MAIPHFHQMFLPTLQSFSDETIHSVDEINRSLIEYYHLSDEELGEMLPTGRQSRFDNRTAWSRNHLKKAGLIESVMRGRYQLTDRGREVLQNPPEQIDIKFLAQYPEYNIPSERTRSESEADVPAQSAPKPAADSTEPAQGITRRGRGRPRKNPVDAEASAGTVEMPRRRPGRPRKERSDDDKASAKPSNGRRGRRTSGRLRASETASMLDAAYSTYRRSLTDELIERLRVASPELFGELLYNLLAAMNYTSGEGDDLVFDARQGSEGMLLHAALQRDPLGFDALYIEAHQAITPVKKHDIRTFLDVMRAGRMSKGVYISTAVSSDTRRENIRAYLAGLREQIILLDGGDLAERMMRYGIGVIHRTTYLVETLDPEAFKDIDE